GRLLLPQLDAVVDPLDRLVQRARGRRQLVRGEERLDVVARARVAERAQRADEVHVAERNRDLRFELGPALLHERPCARSRGRVAEELPEVDRGVLAAELWRERVLQSAI